MVLNSWPLSFVCTEEPLTPSHLLIGWRVLNLPAWHHMDTIIFNHADQKNAALYVTKHLNITLKWENMWRNCDRTEEAKHIWKSEGVWIRENGPSYTPVTPKVKATPWNIWTCTLIDSLVNQPLPVLTIRQQCVVTIRYCSLFSFTNPMFQSDYSISLPCPRVVLSSLT